LPEAKTSPRRLEAALRMKRALELRMAGYTYQEIATAVGYKTRQGAIMAVEALLARTLTPPAEQWRALTVERLTKVLQVFWQPMAEKDEKAAAVVLKAISDLREILGIDAPTQHELSGPGGGPVQVEHIASLVDKMTDEEVERAVAEAELLVQGR